MECFPKIKRSGFVFCNIRKLGLVMEKYHISLLLISDRQGIDFLFWLFLSSVLTPAGWLEKVNMNQRCNVLVWIFRSLLDSFEIKISNGLSSQIQILSNVNNSIFLLPRNFFSWIFVDIHFFTERNKIFQKFRSFNWKRYQYHLPICL